MKSTLDLEKFKGLSLRLCFSMGIPSIIAKISAMAADMLSNIDHWCMIKRDESSSGTYNFRYRAGWGLLQFGDYTHPVRTTQEDGALSLNHSMTLPNNFGTYRVKGQVSPTRFECRFQGNGDKGTMTLQRPL